MKQQQALLTTFLRTATGSAGTSPLRTAATSPRRASPPLTSNTTNTTAKNEADIPWPEIDLTGNQTSPSSTSTPSSSSPYTPLKRKAESKSSAKKSGKIELQQPSPKRTKKVEAALPALGVVLDGEKQPDSLEDVEEFDDEVEDEQKNKKKEMELTDEELIAISEQIERGRRDDATAGRPVPAGLSSPLRPSSSAVAASSPHPFFARGGRGKRWGKEFYEVDCETLAKMLLGQVLVRITSDNQRYRYLLLCARVSTCARTITSLSALIVESCPYQARGTDCGNGGLPGRGGQGCPLLWRQDHRQEQEVRHVPMQPQACLPWMLMIAIVLTTNACAYVYLQHV
jgi:hypothetical protein